MLYLNEYDIERHLRRRAEHPVLGPACWTLANLVTWTNSHSDGWAYWPKPCRAAEKLQRLIEGDSQSFYDDERTDATAEAYALALRPIKAFRTKQGADFEIVEVDKAQVEAQAFLDEHIKIIVVRP